MRSGDDDDDGYHGHGHDLDLDLDRDGGLYLRDAKTNPIQR